MNLKQQIEEILGKIEVDVGYHGPGDESILEVGQGVEVAVEQLTKLIEQREREAVEGFVKEVKAVTHISEIDYLRINEQAVKYLQEREQDDL